MKSDDAKKPSIERRIRRDLGERPSRRVNESEERLVILPTRSWKRCRIESRR